MTFRVGENTYRARKMPAMLQFHVARRMTPFITGLIGNLPPDVIGKAMRREKIDLSAIDPVAMLEPIMKNMGAMSDEDSEYVINACLENCERALGKDTGWGPVKVLNAGMQYQDIDMVGMLQITWGVIQENLGAFFPAALLNTTEQEQMGQASSG